MASAGQGFGVLPKRFAFGGYPNAMLAKTATSWEEENGPFSSAMTVMTMMTVFLRYTIIRVYLTFIVMTVIIVTGTMDIRRACLVVRSVLGADRLLRQFLLSPYKDVINDILAIVIIGDKDAVYDILVSQKPEGHPGAPPQETVSSAAWAWSFSGKKTNEKTRREQMFLRSIAATKNSTGLSRLTLSHCC